MSLGENTYLYQLARENKSCQNPAIIQSLLTIEMVQDYKLSLSKAGVPGSPIASRSKTNIQQNRDSHEEKPTHRSIIAHGWSNVGMDPSHFQGSELKYTASPPRRLPSHSRNSAATDPTRPTRPRSSGLRCEPRRAPSTTGRGCCLHQGQDSVQSTTPEQDPAWALSTQSESRSSSLYSEKSKKSKPSPPLDAIGGVELREISTFPSDPKLFTLSDRLLKI